MHLRDVVEEQTLRRVADAWREFASGRWAGFAYANHIDVANLRAGRQEVWLPFAAPFNSTALLRAPMIVDLLADVFGTPEFVLAYVTVIVAKPGLALTQPMHSDVASTNYHVPKRAFSDMRTSARE